MSSFFGKIKGIFSFRNKKVFLSVFLLLILTISLILIQPVFASDIADNLVRYLVDFLVEILLGISKFLLSMTIWASQLFITIASYSNFINSNAVKLGWVLVRDIVNMFFVVILLAIAFGTVLGLEQYEWKKLMIKLLFAAVLVNFSRLICGVIIDVAQVFMMTFVNGFAATAGGNVINGLNLDKLYNYKAGISGEEIGKAVGSNIDKLITGIGAVFFSSISFFVILAYLFVVLARVVALWTLIILSPIAFISNVLPATQKYASEWWKEFNNYVLAGPILAFFFWLAFAIVGAGNAFDEFKISGNRQQEIEGVFAGTAAGLTSAMEWGNMASFAVAIALLMIGVKKTQELGVAGASALGTAMSTATKTAKVLSGVAAAGWVGQKSLQAGKWAAKGVATGVAMNVPLVGGNAWKNYYETAKAGAKRRVAKSLAEGGAAGWVYNRATKNAKLNKQLQGENEAWDNVLDDLSGAKANWNQKNKNAGVKEYGELLKRKKEAGAAGVKETAQGFVDTENFGLRDEVLEAELRGIQTGGIIKGREDLSREQIAKRLMSEETQVEAGKEEEKEGFKIKQQELERLKEKMEEYKKSSDADKDKISAEAKKEILKDKGFEAMRDQTVETKLETKQIKDEVATRETNRELEKIQELLKENNKYTEKQGEIDDLKAAGGTLQSVQERNREIELATAKDRKLIADGGVARFEEAVRQKHNKEDVAAYSVVNSDKMQANIGSLKSKIATEANSTKKTAMINDLNNWISAANSRGAGFGGPALEKAMVNSSINMDDVASVQAAHLSALLQEEVAQSATGVTAAMKKLKEVKGDGFDAFMNNYVNGLSSSADDGLVQNAGLFKLDEKGESYIATTNSDKDYIDGKRNYALSNARTHAKGIGGALDYRNGKRVIGSDSAKESVVKVVGGKTSAGYANMNQLTIDDVKMSINNAESETEMKKIKETFEEIKASVKNNKGAWEALLGKLQLNEQQMAKAGITKISPEEVKKVLKEVEEVEEELAEDVDELTNLMKERNE